MAKKCKNKYRFKIWNEAQRFAESYKAEVILSFNPMRPYWCDKHELWHIGHNIRERMEYTDNGVRIVSNINQTNFLLENNVKYISTISEDEYEDAYEFENIN